MKAKEIELGGKYKMKVSDRVVTVKVMAVDASYPKKRWRCRNLATGREIIVYSAQRFRERVADETTSETPSETPFVKMINECRSANVGGICLFRVGDFYELFYDDAKIGAQVLGLTLTARDKGPSPIPMSGFPYHQLDAYSKKLAAAGCRVAVIEPKV